MEKRKARRGLLTHVVRRAVGKGRDLVGLELAADFEYHQLGGEDSNLDRGIQSPLSYH